MSVHAYAQPITPRRLETPDLSEVPRHWVDGEPFLTALFNALSLVFPPGERFFVESVRALSDHVQDPKLREDVRGFLAQESQHSRQHAYFNEWLESFGIEARAIMAGVADGIASRQGRRTPLQNLAVTCALEHFTAIMAEAWLTNESLRSLVDPRVVNLWTWHAIEEVEHRAVAFDVYQSAGGTYRMRIAMMMMISVGFTVSTAMLQTMLLRQEGEQRNWRSMRKGLARMWGPRRGVFTRIIPKYLRYYAPNFHPHENGHSDLVARFETQLREAGVLDEAYSFGARVVPS